LLAGSWGRGAGGPPSRRPTLRRYQLTVTAYELFRSAVNFKRWGPRSSSHFALRDRTAASPSTLRGLVHAGGDRPHNVWDAELRAERRGVADHLARRRWSKSGELLALRTKKPFGGGGAGAVSRNNHPPPSPSTKKKLRRIGRRSEDGGASKTGSSNTTDGSLQMNRLPGLWRASLLFLSVPPPLGVERAEGGAQPPCCALPRCTREWGYRRNS